jgi:hypothetical protein
MPRPQKIFCVILYYSLQLRYFAPVKPTAGVQSYRIKPKFSHLVFSFYMHVWRLVAVSGIEEKPE